MKEEIFPNQKDERTHRSDVLLRFIDSSKNIKVFQGKKFDKIFSSEESKRLFIENMQNDDFIELVTGVNGILRDIKKEDWKMDGENVTLGLDEGNPEYIPPLHEDKLMLFEQALQAAKKMEIDGRSIKDIAILISSSINAIHPFNDANGRTSRFVYLALTRLYGEDLHNDLNLALSDAGRFESVDINPGKIENKIISVLKEKNGLNDPETNKDNIFEVEWEGSKSDIEFNPRVSEKTKAELLKIVSDKDYGDLTFFKYLNQKVINNKYLKHHEPCDHFGKYLPSRNNILINELFKDIDEEEAKIIFSIYRNTKIEYIQTLIDSIANPDKSEYEINDKKTTILELFKKYIKDIENEKK
ncbi:MAG: Fic family protein [Parcubacteria group bacterium]|jgi:hypothetical protein